MRRVWPLVLLTACAGRIPSEAPPEPAAQATNPEAAAASSSRVAIPRQAELSRLPERFAKLGEACESIDDNDGVEPQCDDSGVAVGLWAPVDTVHGAPPDSAELVHHSPRDEKARGAELTVSLEGGRLWVMQVSCGSCARVMGWAFVGELPELTDEHLREIQARIGLPSDPVLRMPEDWRTAFSGK